MGISPNTLISGKALAARFAGLQDHEDDGGHADGDADGHPEGQGLSEQQGADEDGRQGFEHAQDGGLGRADVAGRNRQREQGNHRGDDGQAQEIPPIGEGVDPFQHPSALRCADDGEQQGAGDQRIERDRMFGRVPDAFAPVHDHQIE